MKKITTIVLVVLMCLTVLTGCANADPAENATTEKTGTKAVQTEKATETEAATETETEPVTTEEVTEKITEPVLTEDLEAMNAEPASAFTVSRAFGSDMILQRNEYIRIWGWADESQNGKRVEAEFSGLHGADVIEDGHWLITLGGRLPENTEGQTLRVFGAEGAEYKYENVLVGDVYWIVGQSNVAYPVSVIMAEPLASEPGRKVEISNDMQIRLNRVTMTDLEGITWGTNDVSEDVVPKRGWRKPKQGAYDFSAVGYFTAVMLYNGLERSIPIGMIEFDAAGAALHGFLPNEVRDALKISKAKNGVYTAAGVNPHGSSFMYNHAMYSFQNMPIKGLIWYQGESDCNASNKNNTEYANRFKALVDYLRDKHDQINHDYPVYIVELPPIFENFDYAQVRMNMGTIPSLLKNSHICSSADTWKDKTYGNNLHPYNKWEVSERMAAMILANDYGTGDLDYTEGPVPMSYEVTDDGLTVTVKFIHVGDGLKTEGDALKGVKIITNAKNKWADPLTVEIVGTDSIKITSRSVIKSVGYNTVKDESFPESLTLCSSSGVPCASFRFDTAK